MRKFIVTILLFPLLVHAETSNSVNAQVKVNITPYPTCTSSLSSLRPSGNTNQLDFGITTPDVIQNAPYPAGITEQTVMNTSNINDLYAAGSRGPTHALNFVCDMLPITKTKSSSSADPGFSIFVISNNFVTAESGITLITHDASYQTENQLGFLLFLKDRHSNSNNRVNGVTPRYNNLYLESDSFRLSNGQYRAYIDLYPGLYWINTTARTFSPQTISSTISFRVDYR